MSEVAGLFAGVGGLEHGFREAGFEAALLVEIDPAARAVLKERFPDAELAEDIRSLVCLPPTARVVTAGFPCQDLSPPGGKAGIGGVKSGLVSHVFRLLREAPWVEWLVVENVPFMLQLDRGAAMERIASELEGMGWRWAYRTVDAICAVPQRRRRVVLVASPVHDPAQVLFGDDHAADDDRSWAPGESVGFYWTEGRSGAGLRREAVPTLKVGSSVGIPSAPAVLTSAGDLGTPSIADAERLQGFPASWTEPAEGMAKAVRWRLVGNAVPPPVAWWLARSLASPPGIASTASVRVMCTGSKWPYAAFGGPSCRYQVGIGEGFADGDRPLLSGTLRDPLKRLSERALRGFLSRARCGGLRWPGGFLERLEAHA